MRADGLEGIVVADTRLSHIDGEAGRLVIGGYDVEDLAGSVPFEGVCGLLWGGSLPSPEENEELGRAYQSIAWLMATCPDAQFRDAKRAVAAAEKAIRLDGDGDHRYVETLAAAHASAGNFAEAQRLQKKVIEMAPEAVAEGCRARLREYERDRPFRQSPRTARETWGPRRTN